MEQTTSVQTEPQQSSNPLLDRLRLPGTTFRLPSQGVFYDNGELSPDVRNGEVEVYPMTSMDEIILSTPDKLLSGKAVIEVFLRCIPQILKPEMLLARDVDFLMMCLRHVSFGPTMSITYKHNCENAKERTYDVNIDTMLKSAAPIDPTKINQEYEMSLPNGQKVILKPMTFSGVVEVYQNTAMIKREDMTEEKAQKLIVDGLAAVVKSVDGLSDTNLIREWIAKLPLGYKQQIEQHVQKASNWGVDFEVPKKCEDCGADIILTASANPISFFT